MSRVTDASLSPASVKYENDAASIVERHRKPLSSTSGTAASGKGSENVFVISMDDARWRATQQRLQLAGFPNETLRMWPAVDGKSLKNDANVQRIVHPRVLYSLQSNCPVSTHDIESWGAVGCYLAHWSLWRHVAQSTAMQYAVVFEDDAVPRTDLVGSRFPEVVAQLVREAGGPSNFDILRLEWIDIDDACAQASTGGVRDGFGGARGTANNANAQKHQPFSDNLLRSRGLVVNMCAYVITRRGALRLLAGALPVSDPVDMYLTYAERTDTNFVSLLTRRILTVQDRKNFASQIASAKEREWRRATYCSNALQSSVLDETRPVKSNSRDETIPIWYWIVLGSLIFALIIAISFIFVARAQKNANAEVTVVQENLNKIASR